MYRNLLEYLVKNRKLLISHYVNIKLRIVIDIVNSIENRYVIVDSRNLLVKTNLLEDLRKDTVLVTDKIPVETGFTVIVLEPTSLKNVYIHENILVTTSPLYKRIQYLKLFKPVYVTRIYGNLYEVFIKENMEKYRLRLVKDKLVYEDKPPGLTGRAYDIVRNAILEYGELTVKDVVNMLIRELGVSKIEARRILYRLVAERYLKIVKNHVMF